MARRDLALRLRDARRADRRLETVAQLKQAMTAPDWEIDDYEWHALLVARLPSACELPGKCSTKFRRAMVAAGEGYAARAAARHRKGTIPLGRSLGLGHTFLHNAA